MSKKHSVRLVLFSDGSTQMRSLRLSRTKVILIAFCAVIVIGLLTYSTGKLLSLRYINVAMNDVLEKNQDLQEHLTNVSERLSEVDNQLSSLADSDDQLRVLADIPKIDNDIRMVGIGGVSLPRTDYSDEDELVGKLIFDLDKLEREIRLQRQSFHEIRRQFSEKEELLKHTPSLRPVNGGYRSSGFGRRKDPFTHRSTHHNGLDFSHERGAPVFATADGIVVHSKRTHGLGKVIIIDHGYGFRTAYGHLDIFNASKGQHVKRGQKIGEVGNTGRSTGPHLHYEVHIDKKAVNPMDYFFEGYTNLTRIK